MNHEPTPPTPALRLKPRLRPADGEAPAGAAPAMPAAPAATVPPAAPAPAPTPAPAPAPSEGMKFKLKARTDAAPASAPTVPASVLSALSDPDATIPPRSALPPKPVLAPAAPPPAPSQPAVFAPPASPTQVAAKPSGTRPPLPRFQGQGSVPGATVPPMSARRTIPPFPVPHLKVNLEVAAAVTPDSEPVKRGPGRLIFGAIAVVVLGAGGFFGWKYFLAKPAPASATPEVAAATPAAPAAAAPVPAKPATPAPAAPGGPTPVDTLNKIAALPGNAINKAQDAIAARRANGQSRVDAAALGEDAPAKSAAVKPAAPPPGTSTAMTPVAPNLSATTQLDAAPEASPAFLAWVVNTKVNGVFQGTPGRAMINGRLTRTGENVDAALGIIFDSIDADRKQLLFKDRSGATVSRKY
jgi:hypothetical protein